MPPRISKCLAERYALVDRRSTTLPGMPILQIAQDTWDSHAWVITVALIMISNPLNGTVSIMTGGSRLLWAFAKV